MKQIRRFLAQSWLNRTVLGIALASLFSDWSHEIATAVLPAFLGSLGVTAAWLGIIEGISDGLSSFAKLGSGWLCRGARKLTSFGRPRSRALLHRWPASS